MQANLEGITGTTPALYKMDFTAASSYSTIMQVSPQSAVFADISSPLSNEPSPFASISSDSNDQKQMKQAEQNASVVMVSDWSKFTSEQYYNAEQQSNLDI